MRDDDCKACKVSADEAIGPVQLCPAAHPEEEDEQFRHEETEHEVRRERFDLSRLCISPPPIAHSVFLEQVELRKDRHALQIHRRSPEVVVEAVPAALRSHDLEVRGGRGDDQGENEGRDDEQKSGVLLPDELLTPCVLDVRGARGST